MSDSSARDIFGDLFMWLSSQNGGTPPKTDPEEWLEGCNISGKDLRDKLRDLAMQYDFAWTDMELGTARLRWLGLKDEREPAVSEQARNLASKIRRGAR